MTVRNRDELKGSFKDGQRPSGSDFSDFIDSCLNNVSDGLSVQDGTLQLTNGLWLGSSAGGIPAGGLQYQDNQVKIDNGTGWEIVATGVGFQPLANGAITYTGGNVRIGASSDPTSYPLEVVLGVNTDSQDRVCFGNAVCGNGKADYGAYAVFSHCDRASNTDSALRQGPDGHVEINAPANQSIVIYQNGETPGMCVSPAGNVIIGADNDLSQVPSLPGNSSYILQVSSNLYVDKSAYKGDGKAAWDVPSDARLKDDVHDLEAGLAQVRRVRPVRFRYNGRAGTPAGLAGVGVIAQEIEQVFPEMVGRVPGGLDDEPDAEDLRIYNGSALTFVLVNAVKELALKVEQLEQALAALRMAPGAEATKA